MTIAEALFILSGFILGTFAVAGIVVVLCAMLGLYEDEEQ